MSAIFSKKVDLRSRKAMVGFLTTHDRYFTMNSWNRLTSYANVVKVPRLQLPDDCREMAYTLAYDTDNDWGVYLRITLADFALQNPGYRVCFNGRSNGYLVLMEKDSTASIDGNLDFDDFDIGKLRERVRLVQAFDTLCDDLRDAFIQFCRTHETALVQETTVRDVIRVIPKPCTEPLVEGPCIPSPVTGPTVLRIVPEDDMAILQKYLTGMTHLVFVPANALGDPDTVKKLTELNGARVPYNFMGTADIAIDVIDDLECDSRISDMLDKLEGDENHV